MSKKPSHIPLFPDAYLRDTTHLSTEEHGAYFMLLMAAWGSADCSLPSDEKRLAALTKLSIRRWRNIAPVILEFWTIDRGRMTQGRLLKEWEYVREKSAKAKASVGMRRDRSDGYERNQNVPTNDLHLGGGGGEGSLPRDKLSVESLNTRGPFKIIGGDK